VAEACFASGYAAAGARFGVDEKTARALWLEWAAPRERSLPARAPRFTGIHLARVSGAERAVVTDVSALALVDVLRGSAASDVDGWLGGAAESWAIEAVAISFDPALRDAVARASPRARVMVCPAHSAERGMRAFVSAFRSVRRSIGRSRGSNVSEDLRVFARPRSSLDPDEADGMEAWDDAVLALHDAKERFADALSSGSPATAALILADVRERCLAVPGASIPAALIGAWRGEIAEGVGEAALEPFVEVLGRMAAAWAGRRPPLPFDLARGLAVLRDGPRALSGDDGDETPVGEEPSGSAEVLGVPMDAVALALGGA
jgi:hypothetical protein